MRQGRSSAARRIEPGSGRPPRAKAVMSDVPAGKSRRSSAPRWRDARVSKESTGAEPRGVPLQPDDRARPRWRGKDARRACGLAEASRGIEGRSGNGAPRRQQVLEGGQVGIRSTGRTAGGPCVLRTFCPGDMFHRPPGHEACIGGLRATPRQADRTPLPGGQGTAPPRCDYVFLWPGLGRRGARAPPWGSTGRLVSIAEVLRRPFRLRARRS
jgi:hypothetical protein